MRSAVAANLAVAAVCAGLLLVVVYERHGSAVELESLARLNQGMEQRVEADERQLMHDVKLQQRALRAEASQKLAARSYGDGCTCECPESGCDAEKHQGPVCSCPGEAEAGMPPPFAPFNFDGSAARRRSSSPLRTMAARAQPAHMQQAWRLDDKLNKDGVAFPPFFGQSSESKQPHQSSHARMQQKWVGSPQKMLPPDGDYPGGQTGIPLDGYLAYETGWANDGPFHGELAPMQEAGIANKALPHHQILARREGSRRPRLGQNVFGSSFDTKVPAAAIDRDLFTGLRARGATVDAMKDMMH